MVTPLMQLIFINWFGGGGERCVVAGDFNNSIIWDKKGNDNISII